MMAKIGQAAMPKEDRCSRCDDVVLSQFQHTCQAPTIEAFADLSRRLRKLEEKARKKR